MTRQLNILAAVMIGLGSVNGAFRYETVCAVLMLFLAMREE